MSKREPWIHFCTLYTSTDMKDGNPGGGHRHRLPLYMSTNTTGSWPQSGLSEGRDDITSQTALWSWPRKCCLSAQGCHSGWYSRYLMLYNKPFKIYSLKKIISLRKLQFGQGSIVKAHLSSMLNQLGFFGGSRGGEGERLEILFLR